MTFTDDDLKRLTLFINADDNGNAIVAEDFIVESKLKSLLARLEAAEEVIKNIEEGHFIQPFTYEKWRKAAGK